MQTLPCYVDEGSLALLQHNWTNRLRAQENWLQDSLNMYRNAQDTAQTLTLTAKILS